MLGSICPEPQPCRSPRWTPSCRGHGRNRRPDPSSSPASRPRAGSLAGPPRRLAATSCRASPDALSAWRGLLRLRGGAATRQDEAGGRERQRHLHANSPLGDRRSRAGIRVALVVSAMTAAADAQTSPKPAAAVGREFRLQLRGAIGAARRSEPVTWLGTHAVLTRHIPGLPATPASRGAGRQPPPSRWQGTSRRSPAPNG